MALIGVNGGLIGAARTSRRGAAVGMWTANEQVIYQRQNTWIGDANFANVSLLLHMDGSNGSTTFVDSSINALSITANGNAQISTAQSKFGGASGLFDGTGDWLTASLPSAIGTGDFTLESWIYINSLASSAPLCCLGDDFASSGLLVFITTGGRIGAYGNDASIATGSTEIVSTGAWTHLAVTRAGSSLKLFVNGINDGTATNSANLSNVITQVGRELYNTATGAQLNGYIDDLRITTGIARYTASFTPPAAAFPDA